MATYKPIWQLQADSGTITYQDVSYTSTHTVEIDEPIADAQTDQEITLAIDISAVKAFFLVSDQALTVEGNDSVGVAGSVTLVANVPYTWTTDTYDTFKFTADLTSIFVTNASGATANLQLRCLQDASP